MIGAGQPINVTGLNSSRQAGLRVKFRAQIEPHIKQTSINTWCTNLWIEGKYHDEKNVWEGGSRRVADAQWDQLRVLSSGHGSWNDNVDIHIRDDYLIRWKGRQKIDHEKPWKPSQEFGLEPRADRKMGLYFRPVVQLEWEASSRQGSQFDHCKSRQDEMRLSVRLSSGNRDGRSRQEPIPRLRTWREI